MTQTPQHLRLTSAFEPFTIALIHQMEADGWIGRISRKGHAIMLAPDGRTSCSISPKVGAPHRAHNLGVEYRRWKREQEAQQVEEAPQAPQAETVWLPWPVMPPAPLLIAPEPIRVPVGYLCDHETCLREFKTLQALSVHRVRAHVRVDCPICGRPFSPGNLHRHLRGHAETRLDPIELQHELYAARQEIARLRGEVTIWQALAEETEESLVNTLGDSSPTRR